MTSIRPSLRKMEKAERKSGDLHGATKAAQSLVIGRIRDALDRISVAAQFDEFTGSVPAQLGHAKRYIRFGAAAEPETFSSPVVDETRADELVQTLAWLYHDALVAELMSRAAERAGRKAEVE